jgi:hypothetical protein
MAFYDFEGFDDGTLLDTAYPEFDVLANSNSSTITIVDGALNHNYLAGGTTYATYAIALANANHYVEITYATAAKGNLFPMVIRATDARNFIGARVTTANNLEVHRVVAGATTSIISVAVTLATSSVAKLEGDGDTINVYFDGALAGTATETTFNTAVLAGFNVRAATLTQVAASATIDTLAFAEITDINSGAAVDGDSSGNTFTTTGFTEDITDVEIGGLVCTNVVEAAGSGTFDVPPPVDGEVYPELGVNQDVVISGATESATLAKMFELGTYTITELVDPELVDITYPTALFDVVPVTTDLMITEEGITPSADGGVTLPSPAIKTIMHWVRATGVMYIYSFEINQSGVATNSIVARHIVASSPVARSIVARGL